MITLIFAAVSQSQTLEVLGAIAATLEACASVFLIVMKIVTIVKSKELTDKEKLDKLDQLSKKK